MLTYRYPRTFNNSILKGRRTNVRNFCSGVKLIKPSFDLKKTRDMAEIKLVYNNVGKDAKTSIISGDLNKEIMIYSSASDIINKLSTFKIDKCGKYINLTKKFLCDSNFLKLAYQMIKNNSGINTKSLDGETLDGINVK
jgi:hypothetical protein